MAAAVTLDAHQGLGRQQAEGLTHYADADPEPLPQFHGLQPLPGREPTIEDVGPQLVVDVDRETLAARSLGHAQDNITRH